MYSCGSSEDPAPPDEIKVVNRRGHRKEPREKESWVQFVSKTKSRSVTQHVLTGPSLVEGILALVVSGKARGKCEAEEGDD